MNFLTSLANTITRPTLESNQTKDVVKSTNVEIGTTISLKSLDGEIFQCGVLVTDPTTDKCFIKDKHILAVTKNHLVELTPAVLLFGMATVCEVHDLGALSKLKFRKAVKSDGVLILEYKSGKVSKFVMRDPSSCVDLIKQNMKDRGLKSVIAKSHRSLRYIATANEFMEQAAEIEQKFSMTPSLTLIEEMMSLLRQAAEIYSEANDPFYENVLSRIRDFLLRDDVVQVLEGAYKKHREQHVDSDRTVDESILLIEEYKDCVSGPKSPTPAFLQKLDEGKGKARPFPLLSLPSEEDTFASLRRAMTYESDEYDEFIIDGRKGKKPADNETDAEEELQEFLQKLDQEFNVMVESFSAEYHKSNPNSQPGSQRPSRAPSVDFTELDHLDKLLSEL